MRLFSLVSVLLLAAPACVPLGTPITDPNAARRPAGQRPPEYYADKTIHYDDYVYNPDVRSVQCYVATGQPTEVFQPPVVPLSQGQPVTLEFDLLASGSQRFTTKVIHCDANWQPSVLTDMQILSEINEVLITDYRVGVATKVPYYHYRTQMPQVKLSGNYLWVVQGAGGVPVLSRRVLVYENQVEVALKQGIPVAGAERYTLQQADFSIGYGGVQLVNPAQEVKVVLRQNFRWDNAKYNLRPTFVRDAEQRLRVPVLQLRECLCRRQRVPLLRPALFAGDGRGHGSARPAHLAPHRDPDARDFPQWPGPTPSTTTSTAQRVFENREYGNGATNGDYASVTFQLRADQQAPGPVYILGGLTDWKLQDAFRMTYDEETHQYSARVLLKQGYYNYEYVVARPGKSPDDVYFEGSHQETENQYDLLVYYRPPGTRADLLIGYQSLDLNRRQR